MKTKNQYPPFAMMPLKLLKVSISHTAHRVFFVLRAHGDKNGRGIYPSVETIANYAEMSRSTVNRSLNELRKLRIITWESGYQHKANEYSFLPESLWITEKILMPDSDPDGSPAVTCSSISSTINGHQMAHHGTPDSDPDGSPAVTSRFKNEHQMVHQRSPVGSPVNHQLDPLTRSIRTRSINYYANAFEIPKEPTEEDLEARRKILKQQARELAEGEFKK